MSQRGPKPKAQPQPEPERPLTQKVVVDDLDSLLTVLPPPIQEGLRTKGQIQDLLEVILDLGRLPLARFRDGEETPSPHEVTEADLDLVASRIGFFGDDNRAGIERTLHRISCLRNRSGKIIGLTCRVGRAVFGTIQVIEDLVMSGQSILLLGRPGVGKTTMLREVARVLADDAHRRVVVVDTSNEIAGDGDIPHPAIGRARRMQVKTPSLQHAVMIEAVENHMPEVIIIDEMGTELEAAAARTIAERGVQLIATAHGNTLDNLVMNPTLADLVGGIQTVTLGDDEARRRGTQKSVLERKAPPTFDILVEIQEWDQVAVHAELAATVDSLLRGYAVTPEVRRMDSEGHIHKGEGEPITLSALPTRQEPFTDELFSRGRFSRGRRRMWRSPDGGEGVTAYHSETPLVPEEAPPPMKLHRLFPYGISRDRLSHAIRYFGIGGELVSSVADADIVLTTKMHYRKKTDLLRAAQEQGKSIYVLRKNTQVQIEQFLKGLSAGWGRGSRSQTTEALAEVEEAVGQVIGGEPSVELSPQTSYVRRLQHLLAERYNLATASTGREPQRRVIIYQP